MFRLNQLQINRVVPSGNPQCQSLYEYMNRSRIVLLQDSAELTASLFLIVKGSAQTQMLVSVVNLWSFTGCVIRDIYKTLEISFQAKVNKIFQKKRIIKMIFNILYFIHIYKLTISII